MSVLVCGGAGYIGSHFVRRLVREGEDVLVLDDLSTGHAQAVDPHARMIVGDIGDQALLREIFRRYPIEAVIHFAASSQVGESMKNPLAYYRNNVCNTQRLLEVMDEFSTRFLVFSSSAAVYGDPGTDPITEQTATRPVNPYGESKLAMERMIHWTAQAGSLRYLSMRYFNVAGASMEGTIGEDHRPETHIIPLAVKAALENRPFTLFGQDYPTPDGTCIRDYIHVEDLADAHLLALNALRAGHPSDVFNLGSGSGFSNGEIIRAIQAVTGREFPVQSGPRRAGDPARLVAVSDRIRRELGWKPAYDDIGALIRTAVQWHRQHPQGYRD